jgi:FkbM family methyltransferase
LAQLSQPLIRGRRGLFKADYLRSLGFGVKTVFDIGVYKGTPHLYKAFADCVFVLVDPLRNCESLLECPPRRYHFVNKGLASVPGTLTLTEQASGKTSFLERTALTAEPISNRYEVTVTTLDLLLDELDIEAPIGIKIDAEGGELDILKGLTRHWEKVQFVICEASVRKRFVNSYQLSELVAYMLTRGFFFFNFLNLPQEHPRYYDILFVSKENRLFD